MRVKRLRWSLLLVIAAACGKKDATGVSTSPVAGPLSGDWRADDDSFLSTLVLTEVLSPGAVTGNVNGTGAISGPRIAGGRVSFIVTGTDSATWVHLTWNDAAHRAAYFSGFLYPDLSLRGNLDSSGFSHLFLNFARTSSVSALGPSLRHR